MRWNELVQLVGRALDLGGVVVIAGGTLVATVIFAYRLVAARRLTDAYRLYREGVGRAILLGLELLIAGDIVRTVAIAPTFQSMGVLAIIVAIRTFLSISLEVELEGRWPWEPKNAKLR